jgi:RNA polymerase sigma factor (sigma-70 family)
LVRDSLRRRRYERVHLDAPLAAGPGIDESGYPLEAHRTWKDVLPDRSIPLPEEVVELKATWEELEAALNRLPTDQRQIFVLRAMEGLTPPEIAAMLGRPLPEVLAGYRVAREVLRRWFFEGTAASGARAEQQVQHQGE